MGETLEGGVVFWGGLPPRYGGSHTCSCESHLGSHKVIRDLPPFDNSKNGRGEKILTLYRATKGKPSLWLEECQRCLYKPLIFKINGKASWLGPSEGGVPHAHSRVLRGAGFRGVFAPEDGSLDSAPLICLISAETLPGLHCHSVCFAGEGTEAQRWEGHTHGPRWS